MNLRKILAYLAFIIFISTTFYAAHKLLNQIIQNQEAILEKITQRTRIIEKKNKEITTAQTQCLIENAYHEARNQGEEGIAATVHVVLNRVASGQFPNTPCGVIKQHTMDTCQFSWYCMSNMRMRNKEMLAHVTTSVNKAITEWYFGKDVTNGATFYHATYVKPRWKNLQVVTQIGDHIFYRPKESCQNNQKDCTRKRVSQI